VLIFTLPHPPPWPTPSPRYLSDQHDATTVGVLLGLAASHKGSGDPLVAKMLLLHLPTTHPSSFPEVELSPLVQVHDGGLGGWVASHSMQTGWVL
jgi:hypothetical protein